MTSPINRYEARETERSVLALLVQDFEKNRAMLDRIKPMDFVSDQYRAIYVFSLIWNVSKRAPRLAKGFQ